MHFRGDEKLEVQPHNLSTRSWSACWNMSLGNDANGWSDSLWGAFFGWAKQKRDVVSRCAFISISELVSKKIQRLGGVSNMFPKLVNGVSNMSPKLVNLAVSRDAEHKQHPKLLGCPCLLVRSHHKPNSWKHVLPSCNPWYCHHGNPMIRGTCSNL